MVTEERRNEQEEEEKEQLYKTKLIQFFGRTTPIILQNNNGPCPLLAICNVLLLKNNLSLSLDTSEVSLQKLLSLVAERLLDSNSNIENKDAGYLENQRQNIADAIDLLPRLATGIDVNVQFRRIDDFEYTRECTIFDLLDIPLYHGWIIDPQESYTVDAIGSKSYNTLMGELVALEATEEMRRSYSEEDCIDFAAATTATLGVPSPCLSRGRSFEDSPRSESGHNRARKGDLEEEAELLRALAISNNESTTSCDESLPGETNRNDLVVSSDETTHFKSFETGVLTNMLEVHPGDHQHSCQLEQSLDTKDSSRCNSGRQSPETSSLENIHSKSNALSETSPDHSSVRDPAEHMIFNDLNTSVSSAASVQYQTEPLSDPVKDSYTEFKDAKNGNIDEMCPQASTSSTPLRKEENDQCCYENTAFSGTSTTHMDSDLSGSTREHIGIPKSDTFSLDGSEPIYEGEDRILDSGVTSYRSQEPMYEGEVKLAEQAERGSSKVDPQYITQDNGELIRHFLRNSASQLTIYGLFRLQEDLKERELCVFFRNNHFSTMFKFKGELYLLATDQGYINQPDLVWEKLNEVNGDTVFMTGNFTEFKVENHTDTWNQQSAMASTADYLASIDNSTPTDSAFSTDLRYAIALQQEELEKQQNRNQISQQGTSQQQTSQQASFGGHSRLVTGPQVQRSNPSQSSSKQDAKSKEKCSLM